MVSRHGETVENLDRSGAGLVQVTLDSFAPWASYCSSKRNNPPVQEQLTDFCSAVVGMAKINELLGH